MLTLQAEQCSSSKVNVGIIWTRRSGTDFMIRKLRPMRELDISLTGLAGQPHSWRFSCCATVSSRVPGHPAEERQQNPH